MKHLIIILLTFTAIVSCSAQNLERIQLDKNFIESFPAHEEFESSRTVFKKISEVYLNAPDELNKPAIVLYNVEGWENEPGEIWKIAVKTSAGKSVEVKNVDAWIKVPKEFQNNSSTPYFLTVDSNSSRSVIAFFGYPYASEPGYLTLLAIYKDDAAVVFNKEFDVQELIKNDLHGYKLKGNFMDKKYELYIGQNRVVFQKL